MSANTDRFGVDPIWESLAHWLGWAIDSMNAGNLGDAGYNLQEFWGEIEGWKSTSLRAKEWGDLMVMDSLSNLTLGHLCTAQIRELLDTGKRYANFGLMVQAVSPVSGLFAAVGLDPRRLNLQEAIKAFQRKRRDAYQKALDLSRRASASLASAGAETSPAESTSSAAWAFVSEQAEDEASEMAEVVSATPSLVNAAQGTAADAVHQLDYAFQRAKESLPEPLRAIPWWVWAAGAAALVLLPILLAPSPRITIARD